MASLLDVSADLISETSKKKRISSSQFFAQDVIKHIEVVTLSDTTNPSCSVSNLILKSFQTALIVTNH